MNEPAHEDTDRTPGDTEDDAKAAVRRENARRVCAPMRQVMEQGKVLSAHMQNPPRWALHFERLDEIERMLASPRAEDQARVAGLNEEFLLDMNADMGASLAESNERLVRFTDQMVQKVEEKKFELPSETRDDLEDLLEPYKDQYRDKMLGEMPIATRRELEEEKRRLSED